MCVLLQMQKIKEMDIVITLKIYFFNIKTISFTKKKQLKYFAQKNKKRKNAILIKS